MRPEPTYHTCKNGKLLKMLPTTAVKQTIPFDSQTVAEEYGHRERKIRETIEIHVNGRVADRISRKLLPSQKTLVYAGEELLIRGGGFSRYVQV